MLVRGRGSEITDPSELAELRALPLRAWAFKNGAADRFLRVETTLISGPRFQDQQTSWPEYSAADASPELGAFRRFLEEMAPEDFRD